MKWGITIANIADMRRPAENISVAQQIGTRHSCCRVHLGVGNGLAMNTLTLSLLLCGWVCV